MQKSSFQDIILKLQNYWASKGAVLWQPYYTQVGAGTMNPATFLRVLGPEPWNVAYVEPSVRPDDGRYGENPNRFQQHTQFQVILKPDPGNPQELYLESLKAIGIDPRQHDIRFVEDNWEQPAISAWGLGWEVWLDGQEITQFTYFQQVGGLPLDPVAVEITYGLERILIALNNAKAIWDEEWAPGVTYGEVRRQEEFEHSKYYFEVADVESMRLVFEKFEAEAKTCLAAGLIVPAHDYVLKCSHTFNILDTRGAIGVTERQGYFRRMRDLARQVAEAYLAQRQEQEYPLIKKSKEMAGKKSAPLLSSFNTKPATFLLEIGTEELPYGDVEDVLNQLNQRVPAWLAELHLQFDSASVQATPRRIAVSIANLSPSQPDREEVVKGPPAERAFDSAGVATPAAIGFASKNGVDVKDLQIREQDGGKYVFAVVKQTGQPTAQVLSEALPALIAGIKFEKSMKWNDSGVAFSRPIRWIVSLFGEQVIPFEYAGVSAGNISRGLRPYDSPEIEIKSADAYFAEMEKAGIVINVETRIALIKEQVQKAAKSVGGEAILDEGLLAEVANLIEKPTAVLGSFNQEFLSLPRDVLISTMKKHQRYFPVQKDGQLLANFIAIRNGDEQHLDIVRQGNEHVLGARFADANFFVREDIKYPLEHYRPQLSTLIFQTKLGSMLDKSDRMVKLIKELASLINLDAEETQFAERAAYLAKADLATKMVTEMTSLQGIIGREYAMRTNESLGAAKAIAEQYLSVPPSKVGVALALTDRLDSLVGLFAAGLAPTGTKDPFGLRRAAIGTVQPLIEHNISFDLREAINKAAALQPINVSDEIKAQVLDFVTGRLRVLLAEAGNRHDVVEAVLAEQAHNPAASAKAVSELSAWVAKPNWTETLDAFARCVRITRDKKEPFVIKPQAFEMEEERNLYAALERAQAAKRAAGSADDFLQAFVPMIPAVNAFFEKVMVMAEEQTARENRLGLLQRIAALASGVADLSKLEGF